MNKILFALACLSALAACETPPETEEPAAPAVELTSDEALAVNQLAGGIADSLNSLPAFSGSSGIQFLGATVEGRRIIVQERLPLPRQRYIPASLTELRRYLRSNFRRAMCAPDTDMRVFVGLGGEFQLKVLDSTRRQVAEVTIDRC